MERLSLSINAVNTFDEILATALSEGQDIIIVTKDKATTGGNPAVMFSWTARLPNGASHRVQAVTTLRCFMQAADVLKAHYGEF